MADKDKLQQYVAKPYTVNAVLVTEENMRELAKEFGYKISLYEGCMIHELWDDRVYLDQYLVQEGKYPKAMNADEFERKFGSVAESGGYKHVEERSEPL